ncbi:MFS transporter [Klebsiella pneumoniae]|uniref:MFS transporter n=1 Tax=Klebsiella pneumoniae TaxID=573 RepID=A0A927DA26_KLEPN|nr:MFS transporter [Klebsiella pneumoniae]
MINYLDRTILGYCSATVKQRNPYRSGDDGHHLLRLRHRTYALAQIPGGMFLDRFGNKVTYALSIFFWSLFTLLQSFTLGLKSLLLLRLGTRRQRSALLSGQQPHRQHRFPQHERARATATYTVGEYIGLAAFSPLLFLILEHHGWRTLFSSPAD